MSTTVSLCHLPDSLLHSPLQSEPSTAHSAPHFFSLFTPPSQALCMGKRQNHVIWFEQIMCGLTGSGPKAKSVSSWKHMDGWIDAQIAMHILRQPQGSKHVCSVSSSLHVTNLCVPWVQDKLHLGLKLTIIYYCWMANYFVDSWIKCLVCKMPDSYNCLLQFHTSEIDIQFNSI